MNAGRGKRAWKPGQDLENERTVIEVALYYYIFPFGLKTNPADLEFGMKEEVFPESWGTPGIQDDPKIWLSWENGYHCKILHYR